MPDPEIAEMASQAIRAHGAWKMKLASAAISGNLPQPADEIRRDDCCAFGKWIVQEASQPRSRDSANFKKVRELHTRFHGVAGDIAEMISQGQGAKAKEQIEGPAYQKATSELTSAVMAWKSQG